MGEPATTADAFGPYLVRERLGVGGMATVHRALERGLEGLERIVALKRLLPHLSGDASLVRAFVREARLASLLQHANIVQIFALGRVGSTYFISMEYVEGYDVRRLLRQARTKVGPPPLGVTLALIRQVCDALDYAHRRYDVDGTPLGLVHRDVSPANLLLTRTGHIKVIDFGIAKAQAAHLRTQTGRVKGKVAYMAPEALGGRDLDHRSDLYSLGVVFHELITARPLFARKNDYETLLKVQRGEIPRPSSMRAGLPPILDDIVMRALAHDPDERWGSAAELRDALADVPLLSPGPASPDQVAAWCARAFSDGVPPAQGGEEAEDAAWGRESTAVEPVILDDVPDYALHGFGDDPTTVPEAIPFATEMGWPRIDTIENTAPPPARAGLPRAARVTERGPGRASRPPDSAPHSREPSIKPATATDATTTPPTDVATAPAAPAEPIARAEDAPIDPSDLPVVERPTIPIPEYQRAPVAAPVEAAPAPPAPRPALFGLSIRLAIAAAIGGAAVTIGVFAAGLGDDDKPATTVPAAATPAIAPAAAPPAALIGNLTVAVHPNDVAIVIDDLPPHIGSPYTVEVAPGEHRIEARRDGYETWVTSVDVKAGGIQTVQGALVEDAPLAVPALATLALDSTPRGLEVLLDDIVLEFPTPIRMGVAPGPHTLVVRAKGAAIWSTEFVARENTSHRFHARAPAPAPRIRDVDADAAPSEQPDPVTGPADAAPSSESAPSGPPDAAPRPAPADDAAPRATPPRVTTPDAGPARTTTPRPDAAATP